jgi:D-alanine-D-alanine ligase
MAKLRLGLLFGGRSVEHEVSIQSARSILEALDPERYEISLIEVDAAGRWSICSHIPPEPGGESERRDLILSATPGVGAFLLRAEGGPESLGLDVIFPIIHGHGGEDGSLQGLLELAEIPYVGSGVLSSALQMDKDIAKQLLSRAGLPVLPWLRFHRSKLEGEGLGEAVRSIEKELGYPVFVKPANSGSSVGIAKACDAAQLAAAIHEALRYDEKLIVEIGLDAREIELAVLGNDDPRTSIPGEILPSHDFYDYEAKYHDNRTELLVPAPLSNEEEMHLRDLALRAFFALEAEGMVRVDFLIDRENGKPYLNELNSLPGFTNVSMYPRLWEASGLSYSDLLDHLIDLALERSGRRGRLEKSRTRPERDADGK